MMSADIFLHSSSRSDLKILIAETVKEQLTEFFNKNKKPDNRYLSRKGVAEQLGISLPTLHRWTMNGTIQAVRIGSSVRYKSSDVDEALKNIQSIKYMRGRTANNLQL